MATVSGFVGTATAITEFLNGCRRVQVTPAIKSDGSYQDERWFDEPQIEVQQAGAYKTPLRKKTTTGGDRPDCPT